jgi:uncharacterized glyoxalase superfamily protein PhnB
MTQTNVTTQVLYPAMRYRDAHAAIDWLERAFGFERQAVYDGPDNTVAHAQLLFNGGLIMLGSSRPNHDDYPVRTPEEVGGLSGSVYAYAADPDALCARAKAAGARIARELADTEYGSREFSVYDCDGQYWTFGTYRP